MGARTHVTQPNGRPAAGRGLRMAAIQRARHYQDLARTHPDEKVFWLCRASYFGRLSLRV
jgi:hypothetical protein